MVRTQAQARNRVNHLRRAIPPPAHAKSCPVVAAQIRKVLHGPRLQPKLTVGAPDDAFEREADRVAEDVMRMPEPAASGEAPAGPPVTPTASSARSTLQRLCSGCDEEMQRQPLEESEEGPDQALQPKAMPGQAPRITPDLDPRLAALRGGGAPLPTSERAFFEPRFGSDFGGVRVHTGNEAADLARRVEARAFTLGRSVVFGAGQYAPGTTAGRALLAHELTHVLQQGAAPVSSAPAEVRPILTAPHERRLQRKIVVAGKDFVPTAQYLRWLERRYGKAMVELIERMHSKGGESSFRFSSFAQLSKEVTFRHHAIRTMNRLGPESLQPGRRRLPDDGSGRLNPDFWEKTSSYRFVVKPGKKASEAVMAIFKPKAGTSLECNTTMVAVQYRAMLRTLGKRAFDKKFPEGEGVRIAMYFTHPDKENHPFSTKHLFATVKINSLEELLPGDWVYFRNFPDYSKHHEGPWKGEHCLYVGGGKFRGLGITEPLSADEMGQLLLIKYNKYLDPQYEKKRFGDGIGMEEYIYRPAIEEIEK